MAGSLSPSSKKPSRKAGKTKVVTAETPFDFLSNEPERINPAILLAEELMRKDLAEILNFNDLAEAEEILQVSRREIETVNNQFIALTKTPGTPGSQIPGGF